MSDKQSAQPEEKLTKKQLKADHPTWCPACDRLRDKGLCASALHLRHLHPLPKGLDEILAKYEHVFVVELNDCGVYGQGQLATILRAAYCNPAIQSITKTDGLAYRVREIVDSVDNFLA